MQTIQKFVSSLRKGIDRMLRCNSVCTGSPFREVVTASCEVSESEKGFDSLEPEALVPFRSIATLNRPLHQTREQLVHTLSARSTTLSFFATLLLQVSSSSIRHRPPRSLSLNPPVKRNPAPDNDVWETYEPV